MLDAKFSCKLLSLLTCITKKKKLEFFSLCIRYKQKAVSLRYKEAPIHVLLLVYVMLP